MALIETATGDLVPRIIRSHRRIWRRGQGQRKDCRSDSRQQKAGKQDTWARWGHRRGSDFTDTPEGSLPAWSPQACCLVPAGSSPCPLPGWMMQGCTQLRSSGEESPSRFESLWWVYLVSGVRGPECRLPSACSPRRPLDKSVLCEYASFLEERACGWG